MKTSKFNSNSFLPFSIFFCMYTQSWKKIKVVNSTISGRTLLMLKSIKRAHKLDDNNPELHSCLVRFLLHTSTSKLEGPLAEVVKLQTSNIFSSPSTSQLNADYLKKNSKSLPHLSQGARMLYLLDPSAQSKALALVSNFEGLEGVDLTTCVSILELLRNGEFGNCENATNDFITKCHKRFPYALAFRPPDNTPREKHV